jgi:hypothetical protein
VKKQKELEETNRRRKINQCKKEECGRTCRTGPGWVGCEVCEEYWFYSECIQDLVVQRRLLRHEDKCSGKE